MAELVRRTRTGLSGRLGVALAAALLLLGIQAGAAAASQEITKFSVTPSTTQAGGHPDLTMEFAVDSPGEPESARNVIVNTPEGIFGNPNAIVRCTSEDFAFERCPSASQAGLITIYAKQGADPHELLGTAPIYNRQPLGDQTALFSFIVPVLNIPVEIPVEIRTAGDYGLRFTVRDLTQLAPLSEAKLTYWGFPADSVHDKQRFPKGSPGSPAGCPAEAGTGCIGGPTAAALEIKPLINNPSRCSGGLNVIAEVETYQDEENPSRAESPYEASTGCAKMHFKPVLLATPTSLEADSPAGLDITMRAPQPLSRATTPSPIRSSRLVLPEGLTINPDAADGQSACRDVDARFDSEGPGQCPDQSKIGTFRVGSGALDGPLEGSIYIGEPKPGDQYRLFMMADGFGIHAKFVGSFRPDPATGRLTADFASLPQVPFESFELHLFASDRGLMATPVRCGVYEVEANFLPWNDALPDQISRQLFALESGPNKSTCPGEVRPFRPRLNAGMSNPVAGAFSDFSLQLDRDDGDQFLGDLNFKMPPGFTGSLRGIPYCPEAAIAAAAQNPGRAETAAPSCPAASLIGTTNVSAGPGSHPFNVLGRIYLAGPLKGAPLSLAAVTPALAGPYDYGTQVVRVGINVDPRTAQVDAVSDRVPEIIGGVPLRLRTIRVSLNRPSFLINPTNCSNFAIHSEGVGNQGTVSGFDSPFHAVNCFSLGFKPSMTVRQVGRKGTRRSANPELRFDLRTRPGDANIKSLAVTLPTSFAIDQRHLGNICSEKELAANKCAGRTPIGRATTTTPLLDQPLSGPAYAVSGSGGLPRLAFILDGQVSIVPRAETKTLSSGNAGRLHTTVPVVPDAPIGHFSLTINGGSTGYLVNTRSLCSGSGTVTVKFEAQNGRKLTQNVRPKAACGKKGKNRRR